MQGFFFVLWKPTVGGQMYFRRSKPLCSLMKKYLFLYAVVVTAAACYGLRHYRAEIGRLRQNQTALASQIDYHRTRSGALAATTQVLQLRCSEYEQLRAEDARRIRELGIKIRRLEAAATLVTAQSTDFTAPLRDTVFIRQQDTLFVQDTVRLFRWNDAWCRVEGLVRPDSVLCQVE